MNKKTEFYLEPIGDKICVQILKARSVSEGGILLPEQAQKRPHEGLVLEVGKGRLLDDGSYAPLTVQQGDIIVFSQYGGSTVEVGGTEFHILTESEILAIKRVYEIDDAIEVDDFSANLQEYGVSPENTASASSRKVSISVCSELSDKDKREQEREMNVQYSYEKSDGIGRPADWPPHTVRPMPLDDDTEPITEPTDLGQGQFGELDDVTTEKRSIFNRMTNAMRSGTIGLTFPAHIITQPND